MPRSIKKGPYCCPKLQRKVEKLREEAGPRGRVVVKKVYSRASTIIPDFIGATIEVHKGNQFVPVVITEQLIKHKLGEFAMTRTFRGHAGDKKTAGAGGKKSKEKSK